VKNRQDGRVEAVFEGEESGVKVLVEFCHRGPRGASQYHHPGGNAAVDGCRSCPPERAAVAGIDAAHTTVIPTRYGARRSCTCERIESMTLSRIMAICQNVIIIAASNPVYILSNGRAVKGKRRNIKCLH
jgi:hypothetical protein